MKPRHVHCSNGAFFSVKSLPAVVVRIMIDWFRDTVIEQTNTNTGGEKHCKPRSSAESWWYTRLPKDNTSKTTAHNPNIKNEKCPDRTNIQPTKVLGDPQFPPF